MRVRRVLLPAAAIGYCGLQWLGRCAGTTRSERTRPLPGDELIENANLESTHATTVDASAGDIWPWLVQMGWHRGGWYTARWVDRLLFPVNWPSADRILPEYQELKVGDFIPDGPPESGCGFVVADLEAERRLVLRSDTHLPLRWRQDLGARLTWTWVFVLEPLGDGRTRFLFRSRARAEPGWVRALYEAAIVPADFVMSRQMMSGLSSRVERSSTTRPPAPTVVR